MKSFDFLDLLGDVPEDLVESCFAAPAIPEHRISRPWLRTCLAAGTVSAACIAAVAGTAFLLHDDGLTQQSGNLEAVMQEVATEPVQTAAEPAQTAPAVTAPPEDTPAVPAQTETAVSVVTKPAAKPAPAETEPTVTEAPPAKTEPAETQPSAEPAPAEPVPVEIEPTPEQPVFEPGDVDMDGKITFVDAALVYIDTRLANYDRLDLSLLTDEQRALGNVDGLENGYLNHWLWNEETQDYDVTDTPFSLTVSWADSDNMNCSYKGDAEIIERVAMLRNWCGLSGLTTQEYIENQEHYDLQLIEWEQQADAEAVTEMHSAYDFYADELRNAIWRTKAQTGVIAWEGNLKEAEQSILLNGDVLYDVDWFYEKAEEMRSFF